MTNVVVAGANRGIGLALVRCHLQRGDQVLGLCRQSSAELQASAARIEAGVEVTDDGVLAGLAERLAGIEIDRLLVCAGVLSSESLDALDSDAAQRIRRQFEVNALAPLRLVHALLPRLGRGSKVGILTSRMGSIADNGSGGYYGYRMSKAALNAAGRSLALDLAPRGISVFLLHPGFVRTDMTGGNGDINAEQSAANLMARVDALGEADSGSFWHANGQSLPW
jgi:NAD(P)-dependent dehydrogenase (short-subunit alcohol dehydrogenase family)